MYVTSIDVEGMGGKKCRMQMQVQVQLSQSKKVLRRSDRRANQSQSHRPRLGFSLFILMWYYYLILSRLPPQRWPPVGTLSSVPGFAFAVTCFRSSSHEYCQLGLWRCLCKALSHNDCVCRLSFPTTSSTCHRLSFSRTC